MTEIGQASQKSKSISPERFYFCNAFKMYGSGGEVFVELGRIVPGEGEEPNIIKGEVGIILSLPAAAQLVAQLQVAINTQMNSLNEKVKMLKQGQEADEGQQRSPA